MTLDARSYDLAEKTRAASRPHEALRCAARRGAFFFAVLVLMLALAPVSSASESAGAPEASSALPLGTLPPEQDSGDARRNALPLRPAEKLRRSINGGETQAFRVSLVQGQYLHALVDQQGIDVVVTLFGTDNQPVTSVDNPNGMYGPESASLVATESGDYFIEVKAGRALAPPGAYTIEIEEPRTPAQADNDRVAAERAVEEGSKLGSQSSPESTRSAVERFEAAVRLWETLGDAQSEAYTWIRLGWAYRGLGEGARFAEALQRALAIMERVDDRRGQAAALNELGAARRAGKEPLQAVPLYQRALQIRREAGDMWGEAQLLNNVGLIYARTGRQREALTNYNEALLLWQKVGDKEFAARVRNNIAGAYNELGETQNALDTYEEMLDFCLTIKNKNLEAFLRNNIAEVYDFRGESLKAVGEYEQALALFSELRDETGEVNTLNNLGMLYAAWGDTRRALDYFTRAPELRERVIDLRAKGNTLYGLGYALAAQDDYEGALKSYEQALAVQQQAQNQQGVANTLISIGMTYNARGDPQTALDYFQRALAIQEQIGDVRGQASALERIADAYRRVGDLPKALDNFGKSYAFWQSVGDKQGEASSLYGLAGVAHAGNNLFEALKRIEEAIGIVESLRTTTTNSQMRLLYFASKRDYYDLDIDVLMQLHRRFPAARYDEAALYASERARARGLLDILGEARANISSDFDVKLFEKSRSVEQALNDKARVLLREKGLKHKEQAAALDKEITALTAEYEDTQAQMRAKSRAYAGLTRPSIVSLNEIQHELLSDDTALLEYALGPKRSYVWVVTRNRLFSGELPGRAEVEDAAGRVRELLTARERRAGEDGAAYMERVARADRQYWESARGLSGIVLGRVAPQLKGVRRLLIVADGGLQLIPFAALADPLQPPGRAAGVDGAEAVVPLAAKYEIVYQPSASTLKILKAGARARATKDLAVFADPVFNRGDERLSPPRADASRAAERSGSDGPELGLALRDVGDTGDIATLPRLTFSKDEARGIMAVLPSGANLKATDFNASRAAAMSPELADYKIVHFATHTIFDDEHPELSGLVLSLVNERGLPQDGFLRLHDIYNLKLNSDLVVLSACRTGVGKDVKGEGLISMTRGFMYAGAPRVVASLWSVKDSATADLMVRFYKHRIVNKESASGALAAAQMEIRRQERWRSPFFWAGFVLQGEWE